MRRPSSLSAPSIALLAAALLASTPAVAQAQDEGEDETTDAQPAGDGQTLAWSLFGASAAVLIGGAITLAVGADDLNAVENAPDGAAWASVEDAYARGPLLTGLGAALLGVGVASFALSAGLLAHFGRDGTWLRVSLGPGTLDVRGAF